MPPTSPEKWQNHHEISAKQRNRGWQDGRRTQKSEQLLGTQPKEGLNQSSNSTGRGEEGFPLAGSLVWEPPARHGTVRGRQAGMRWGRQHRSHSRLSRCHKGCDTKRGAGQLPVCLATPVPPALPLSRPPCPLPPAQQQSGGAPSSRAGWAVPPSPLHPDTGRGMRGGCYLSGASSPLVLPCTGSSLYILVP